MKDYAQQRITNRIYWRKPKVNLRVVFFLLALAWIAAIVVVVLWRL